MFCNTILIEVNILAKQYSEKISSSVSETISVEEYIQT